MTQMALQNYINNPCRVSSIPYWKTKTISVPDGMLIIHDELYNDNYLNKYNVKEQMTCRRTKEKRTTSFCRLFVVEAAHTGVQRPHPWGVLICTDNAYI